jgi:pseudouridine synthase
MTHKQQPTGELVRINKYLAHKGLATRRSADELIEKGRVFVNGKPATLGQMVSENDLVEVKVRDLEAKHVYYAFNKPIGVVTLAPTKGEKDILSMLPKEVIAQKVFPIGRLDKDSHGLIIITNDGRLTRDITGEDSVVEKEYVVKTKKAVSKNIAATLAKGVSIEGYMTKPAKVRLINEKLVSVTLTEGKRHQVRRMIVAVYNEVVDLKRVRIGKLEIGTLKSGALRKIARTDI